MLSKKLCKKCWKQKRPDTEDYWTQHDDEFWNLRGKVFCVKMNERPYSVQYNPPKDCFFELEQSVLGDQLDFEEN